MSNDCCYLSIYLITQYNKLIMVMEFFDKNHIMHHQIYLSTNYQIYNKTTRFHLPGFFT